MRVGNRKTRDLRLEKMILLFIYLLILSLHPFFLSVFFLLHSSFLSFLLGLSCFPSLSFCLLLYDVSLEELEENMRSI
jgi:hypothetical protein